MTLPVRAWPPRYKPKGFARPAGAATTRFRTSVHLPERARELDKSMNEIFGKVAVPEEVDEVYGPPQRAKIESEDN
jgi:hypothetical protein